MAEAPSPVPVAGPSGDGRSATIAALVQPLRRLFGPLFLGEREQIAAPAPGSIQATTLRLLVPSRHVRGRLASFRRSAVLRWSDRRRLQRLVRSPALLLVAMILLLALLAPSAPH
jgi:hypothetical protein